MTIDLDHLPVLSTERLVLRPPSPKDIDDIVPLANDWEVARWLGRLPYPYRRDDAVFFVEEIASREAAWIIRIREGDRMIGAVGLLPNAAAGTAELGYWLGQAFWGSGFATEAGRAVLAYGFETAGLPAMTAGYFAGNDRSARVLAKLGLRPVGTSRRLCVAQCSEVDHIDLVIARRDWRSHADGR